MIVKTANCRSKKRVKIARWLRAVNLLTNKQETFDQSAIAAASKPKWCIHSRITNTNAADVA